MKAKSDISEDNKIEIRSAVHSNYFGMVALVGRDNNIYLGKGENYQYNYSAPSYYNNSDNSILFISKNPVIYDFLYSDGWIYSQDKMLEYGLTKEDYMEFAILQDTVLNKFEKKHDILFDGVPFQPPVEYIQNKSLLNQLEVAKNNIKNKIISEINLNTKDSER